jgi:hypothetical protein
VEDWALIRRLAGEGVPNTRIAERLGISRTTVIKAVKAVPQMALTKPGVSSPSTTMDWLAPNDGPGTHDDRGCLRSRCWDVWWSMSSLWWLMRPHG